MRHKPEFADTPADALIEHDREERQLALEYVAEAWNDAEDDGIDPDALAHASLFAAITTLVQRHGEQAVAALIRTIPDRIDAGEYNLNRTVQ